MKFKLELTRYIFTRLISIVSKPIKVVVGVIVIVVIVFVNRKLGQTPHPSEKRHKLKTLKIA